jgi:hypothetical protein
MDLIKSILTEDEWIYRPVKSILNKDEIRGQYTFNGSINPCIDRY